MTKTRYSNTYKTIKIEEKPICSDHQSPINQQFPLPDAILNFSLFKYLSLKEGVRFAESCKQIHRLPEAKEILTERDKLLAELFYHVTQNQIKKAEILLKVVPDLLLKKSDFTDSGRLFKNMTAFQYALWIYNQPMWQMMLKYFPQDEKLQNSHAARQFSDLEKNGIQYHILNVKNSKMRVSSHFEFGVIQAWQWCVIDVMFEVPEPWEKNHEKNEFWQIGIMEAERLLPKHLTEHFNLTRMYTCETKKERINFVNRFNEKSFKMKKTSRDALAQLKKHLLIQPESPSSCFAFMSKR